MMIRVMTASGFTSARDERVQWWVDTYGDRVKVFDDSERKGVLWNHLQIVTDIVESGEDFSLVVQDDAVPLNGWEEHLQEVIRTATRFPVSLCHFQKRGKEMWDRGICYGYSPSSLWGQAVLYSKEFAQAYLPTVQDIFEIDPIGFQKSDDGVIVVHNLLTGNNSSFTTRALFDHADGHSTLGHLSRGRRPVATIENSPGPWTSEERPRKVNIVPYTHRTVEKLRLYREQVKG